MEGSRATHRGRDGLAALRHELGARPPRGLEALGDDELGLLARALAEVRTEQAHALEQAGEAAFAHIPALLRKPVRKLLGA